MTIIIPIYWEQPNGKTTLVGMNFYRNAHYYLQNRLKQEFTELIVHQLVDVAPITSTFRLELVLFYKTTTCDASNIISLMEKISLDAFKSAGIIIDDNVKYHIGSCYSVAVQDKLNPRCEITISGGI
jgi:Holliday junction resolvase RusA-like endonuclease